MKVLLIGNTYRFSSTGQIAALYHKELVHRGIDCKMVVGLTMGNSIGEDDVIYLQKKYEPLFHMKMSYLTGYEGFFSPFATHQIKKIIDEYKPDIVHLFNLHAYYINSYSLLKYLKKNKIRTVYSMLDEFPYLGRCCYAFDCDGFMHDCHGCKVSKRQYPGTLFFRHSHQIFKIKQKIYSDFSRLSFTGPEWVVERARRSSLLKNARIDVADEFVDTENLYYPRDRKRLRDELHIDKDAIVFLNVCVSSDPRKGAGFYIDAAKRLLEDKRYIFIHVGYIGDKSILPENYIAREYIKDQNLLAEYFSLADCFVCTSMADTMPNTCLNALSSGTPVIGFDITGVPYTADEVCGRFVEAGNLDALVDELIKTEPKNENIEKYCRNYAVGRYSVKTFYDKCQKIYSEPITDAGESII